MSSSTQSNAILLLNLPPKTFVSIDLVSFNSSPNFHGIANIPSGFHCLYTGTDAVLSIRHCHWLNFQPKTSEPQNYVLQWNHEIESLILLRSSDSSAQAAVRSVPSLRGRGLVDYVALQDASSDLRAKQTGFDSSNVVTNENHWPILCRYISSQSLKRILNSAGSADISWTLSSISSAPGDTETIPGLSSEEVADTLHDHNVSPLNLVPVNIKQTWPAGSIGRDRTEKARDRSWYLGQLIDAVTPTVEDDLTEKSRQIGARELLGEIQFCFLMVLILANYSCLEQWKRLLSVVFTCQVALADVEGFFVETVKVLRAQLERVEDIEGGLFEMGDESGSAWLRGLLKTFRKNVDEVFGETDNDEGLTAELSGLEKWLKEAYGWEDENSLLKRGMVDLEDGERIEVQMDGLDEEQETGEYAPVVVEM